MTLAAVLGLSAGSLAFPAPAFATGNFYMEYYGSSLTIGDNGDNYRVSLNSYFGSYYTEVPQSPAGWFLLEDNRGKCLNFAFDGYIWYGYSSGCYSGDTSEEFYKSGYDFEERHTGTYIHSDGINGHQIWLSNATAWATPGA